jgi:uncharacterized protein (DUF849 family)
MAGMNWKPFITCAITGAGATTDKSALVPVTPKQIADASIDAAKAGAAVVHLHVRNPKTGGGSRDVALYKEAVDRIRSSGVDVVINLTAGMGGDLVLGSVEQPLPIADKGTDMAGAEERLAHVKDLLPEICTLDCGSMNFLGGGNYVMVNTPDTLRVMAQRMKELGVLPECEVFDTGHLWQVHDLLAEGHLAAPALIQLCMGIPYGAPAEVNTFMAMVNALPAGCTWSSFAISRMQLPWVAQTVIAGGNVRVGLEDNIWLQKGVKATNAQLVERAVSILQAMNADVMTAAEVRTKLKLTKRG